MRVLGEVKNFQTELLDMPPDLLDKKTSRLDPISYILLVPGLDPFAGVGTIGHPTKGGFRLYYTFSRL